MLKNYYNKNVIIFLYSVNEQTVNNFFLKKIISIIMHRYSFLKTFEMFNIRIFSKIEIN